MSDLQQALKFVQLSNYATSILITGVMYDYFLTISPEVEYIWLKPWTWVSTLFVLVRYFGIVQALLLGIVNNASFPATAMVSTIIYLVGQWLFLLFLAAIDLVMILRIYAMWGRSKIILSFCLFIYVSNVIIGFVFTAVFENPNTYMSVTAQRFLNISFCNVTMNLPLPIWVYLSPSYPISAALLTLPLIKTCKESFNMYKATKRWQPNRYIGLLVKDGIVYFVIRSSYDLQWGIDYEINTPFNFAMPFTTVLSLTLLFSMLPRFIIGIRELYDHDDPAIDTGFGILSRFVAADNVTLSGIVFADESADGEIGNADMIPLTMITSRV